MRSGSFLPGFVNIKLLVVTVLAPPPDAFAIDDKGAVAFDFIPGAFLQHFV